MYEHESAALICRVSTREQEIEGYSLEAQEQFLNDFCDRQGLRVEHKHSFSETASKHKERKKFREFMDEVVAQNIRHLVVEKVDRLTRTGLKEAMMLDEWLEQDAERFVHCVKDGIDLHKHSKSGEKLNWGMRLVLAKNYSDNLSEEVQKTANEMLRRGIWPTKTLVGYFRIKKHPVSPVQQDPKSAPLILEMFKLYETGEYSIGRLAHKMEELGLRNALGNRIMPSRIHILLQDPFYIGQMRYRGKIWQGVHEPIVSVELFERVQGRLKRKSEKSSVVLYSQHKHKIAGLAICDACNKRMSWEVHKGTTYGYCKRYGACSRRATVTEGMVEAHLFPSLEALRIDNHRVADWISRALRATTSQDVNREQERQERLNSELRSVSEKLDRLLEMRIDGEISKEEADGKRGALLTDRARIQEQLNGLNGSAKKGTVDASEVFQLGQEAALLYLAMQPSEQRNVILRVFSAVRVNGSTVSAEYTPDYRALAEAVKQTNCSKVSEEMLRSKPSFELAKIGSGNKKDPLLQESHPVWLAAWEKFRTSFYP